jgi:hypothetical protein
MDNKLTFTGGEPDMSVDDFMRVPNAVREFLQYLLFDYPECIVAGADCTAPGAGNDLVVSTDGFVWLDGELLKVDAGTYNCTGSNAYWRYVKNTSYEAGGNKTFIDSTPRQTWQKKRAIPTSAASISAGQLDCVNGLRWNKVSDWENVTASSVMHSYPDSSLQVRINKGYLEICGEMVGSGAPGSISLLCTLPVGYYELIDRVKAFVGIKTDGASYVVTSFYIDPADGHIHRGESDVTGADTYEINVKIPLLIQ